MILIAHFGLPALAPPAAPAYTSSAYTMAAYHAWPTRRRLRRGGLRIPYAALSYSADWNSTRASVWASRERLTNFASCNVQNVTSKSKCASIST